jgi:hypothetical protein
MYSYYCPSKASILCFKSINISYKVPEVTKLLLPYVGISSHVKLKELSEPSSKIFDISFILLTTLNVPGV